MGEQQLIPVPIGRQAASPHAAATGPAHAAWQKIRSHWQRHGLWSTLRFAASRVWRRWDSLVYDASLAEIAAPPAWPEEERLQVIGPEDVDRALTPELVRFLGGDQAAENLQGIREGNRLFVVSNGHEFLHCGYIMFRTRQSRIIGEDGQPPIIGGCRTVPQAEGRGLYRRALRAELWYLRERGYGRAVIETHPENIASRKGIEAAGFTLRRQVSSWILLNRFVAQKTVDSSAAHWRLVAV